MTICGEVDVEGISVKIAERRGCAGSGHKKTPELTPLSLGTVSFFKARYYIAVFGRVESV